MHNCLRQDVCHLSDANKGITQILYNHLNLPSRITMVKGNITSTINYVYSASGAKLRVIHRPSAVSPTTTTTDYVNGYIFTNNSLSMALTDNGYYTLSSTGDPTYYFYLKDHQGNNRVVVTQNDSIVQTNHYYPYGALFAESTNGDVQRYKYNGKELDRKFGLDWYDHGARHNDAAIGRWHSMDPMAKKYYGISPYAYCGGNPVNNGDYDGKDPIGITAGVCGAIYGIYRAVTEDKSFKVAVGYAAVGFVAGYLSTKGGSPGAAAAWSGGMALLENVADQTIDYVSESNNPTIEGWAVNLDISEAVESGAIGASLGFAGKTMDNVSKGYKAAQLDDIAGKSNKHALKSTKAIGTNQERRQAQRQIETQGKKVSNKEINKKILNEKSSAIELVNFEYEFIRYSIPIVSIPFQGVTSELTDN